MMNRAAADLGRSQQGEISEMSNENAVATTERFVDVSALYSVAPKKRIGTVVPPTVFQTWKDCYLGETHAAEFEKFRKLNDDYSFELFDDAAMAAFMAQRFGDHPIYDIFSRCRFPTSKADIWRLCVLKTYGGVYVDIDSGLSKPFRELVAPDCEELISFELNRRSSQLRRNTYAPPGAYRRFPPVKVWRSLMHPRHVLLNWCLVFRKDHPVLGMMIDRIVKHYDFYRGREFESVWRAIIHFASPLCYTETVWDYIVATGRTPNQITYDFAGTGIFKLVGSDSRLEKSPWYAKAKNKIIVD